MKKTYKILFFVIFTLALILTSCRNEELELIQPENEEVLTADSKAANLIARTSMKDGSLDNIIDRASCVEVKLPVTVIANGLEITITNEDGFDTIEEIFEAIEDDEDILEIFFPITVILNDYTEVTINSMEDLRELAAGCGDEGEEDDDIECIDFKYPFRISVFNPNNEVIETVVIESDRQLYRFVERIEDNDVIRINFPLSLVLSDGSELVVNSLSELERAIENAIDDCDEDDDFDFDDDDCDDCSTDRLKEVLTGCEKWEVEKLLRNNVNQVEQYIGYYFSFSADGTVTVLINGDSVASGTWASSGERNDISFVLDIPNFIDFNDTWILQEVEEEEGEFEIYLRNGEDRLNFESTCGNEEENFEGLAEILQTSNWKISEFEVDEQSFVAEFEGYQIVFEEGGGLFATLNNETVQGGWNIGGEDSSVLALFFQEAPFDDLTEEWEVVQVSETFIKLNASNEQDKVLIFEKI
jgi:hypothetical protein